MAKKLETPTWRIFNWNPNTKRFTYTGAYASREIAIERLSRTFEVFEIPSGGLWLKIESRLDAKDNSWMCVIIADGTEPDPLLLGVDQTEAWKLIER